MSKKTEVKRLLVESGNSDLFNEENYIMGCALTSIVEKNDFMLKQFFKNTEGMREKYIHDLIVKNKRKCI